MRRHEDRRDGRLLWALGIIALVTALAVLCIIASGCGFKLPPIPPCVLDNSCNATPRALATATATIIPSDTPTVAPTSASPTATQEPTATVAPPVATPPARPCPCLNRIGTGPLGGATKPHAGHCTKGQGCLQCWTIDTTPKFGTKPCNPKTGNCGLPDNDDHPSFGGHCEFPGAPSWSVTGATWVSPEDPCTGLSPDGRPNRCYSREVCGAPGQPFTVVTHPPLPLTDLYGVERLTTCAGGDGHGSYQGTF